MSRRTDENRLQAGYRKQSLRKDCTKNVQNGTEKRGKGGKGGKREKSGKRKKGVAVEGGPEKQRERRSGKEAGKKKKNSR